MVAFLSCTWQLILLSCVCLYACEEQARRDAASLDQAVFSVLDGSLGSRPTHDAFDAMQAMSADSRMDAEVFDGGSEGNLTTPVWGTESTLSFERLGPSRFGLVWVPRDLQPEPSAFLIYRDDERIATLASESTSLQLNQVPPGEYVFRVQARGESGLESQNGPRVEVTVLDETSPTFEASARLHAEQVSASEIQLSWSAASDDVGVVNYRVYEGSTLLGSLDASTLTFLVTGCVEGLQYQFRVEAADGAMNVSNRSLYTTVLQVDRTPPEWHSEVSLTTSLVSERSFWLSWEAAVDNVGIRKYRVYLDGAEYGLTEAGRLSLFVDGLEEYELYLAEVFAEDWQSNIGRF